MIPEIIMIFKNLPTFFVRQPRIPRLPFLQKQKKGACLKRQTPLAANWSIFSFS
jgi:hypothetical protein